MATSKEASKPEDILQAKTAAQKFLIAWENHINRIASGKTIDTLASEEHTGDT